MIEVTPLLPEDRARWEVLARGYKTFYKTTLPSADYELAWRRLMTADTVHGLGAQLDGRLVGIAHYLFHPSAWMNDVCYLQDLFVDVAVRGHGVARALIGRVAEAASARGAPRLYWLTAQDNRVARALYDKVAQTKGFIRYDHPLE
ncbi:MAG TPA: GNAT family N-acetyltransferase [Caldimonas sp.]